MKSASVYTAFIILAFHLHALPFANAAIYEPDDLTLAASQLTLTAAADDHPPLSGASSGAGSPQHAYVTAIDPLEDMRKALDVMQTTWFRLWVGTWPTAIDWTRAVLDTYLVATLGSLSKALDSFQKSGSPMLDGKEIENELNHYFGQNVAYYFGEDAFSLRNQAYDDMLWVVLGWLESIKFIKTHSQLHFRPVHEERYAGQTKPWHGSQFIASFAHRARVFYEITTRGWDTRLCGGGLTWNPSLGPYKNAITNQLFISASVGMYLYFPGDRNTSPFMLDDIFEAGLDPALPHDPAYLQAAIDGYDWLKNVGMTNEKGLYVDGFHISNWRTNGTKCDKRNEMVYTYNQGVILSGLRGLWESTGDRMYLEDGHQLVRNSIRATGWLLHGAKALDGDAWEGLGRGGILEERCDAAGDCDQNGHTFKGIFMHHLTLFCEPLPFEPLVPGKSYVADRELAHLHHQSCQEYAIWVAHNSRAALSTRDEKGRFGMWWNPRKGVEAEALPEDAIDYRNNASELRKDLWMPADGFLWTDVMGSVNRQEKASLGSGDWSEALSEYESASKQMVRSPSMSSDLNDRGRGRTVETQGGGVAVLRALWELMNMG